MSLHAILEAFRLAASTIDPILADRQRKFARCPDPEFPDVDDADDLSLAPIVEELQRYAHPTKPRAYVCHPVTAKHPDGSYDLDGLKANLVLARKWLRWLVDHTTWAIGMPWMPYVEELDEATYRERGIADDLALIDGHTLVVLVGARVSTGMAAERDYAVSKGIPLLNLTLTACAEPPEPGSDAAKLLRAVINGCAPGTLRPVDFVGRPVAPNALPRLEGCTSSECEIRNACTRSGGCATAVP